MGQNTFSTRLGFILVSAGCAIGLGNVWRFPFITGKYGGATFVLLYLVFLAILGLPIMVAEFAVGRASVHSPAKAFNVLEPKGSKWHRYKYVMIGGNIPGSTQVISTEIYTYVEAMEYGKAHVLAGGMLVFSFFVLLSLNLLNRKEGRTR